MPLGQFHDNPGGLKWGAGTRRQNFQVRDANGPKCAGDSRHPRPHIGI